MPQRITPVEVEEAGSRSGNTAATSHGIVLAGHCMNEQYSLLLARIGNQTYCVFSGITHAPTSSNILATKHTKQCDLLLKFSITQDTTAANFELVPAAGGFFD